MTQRWSSRRSSWAPTRARRPCARSIDENQANQSGYTATPVELIDAGDKVITVVQVGGAGTASQIALDDQIAFIQTFKNGLVVREQTFRNREEALEAAGLSE